MAEWLYEEGIGEARAALIEHGRLVEALVEREGDAARAGAIAQGRLVATVIPRKRGIARLTSGEEVLVEPIPPKVAEGANVLVEILREAIPEEGRAKLAKGRIAQPGAKAHPGPSLLQRLRATGIPVLPCPTHEEDRLEAHGWSELLEEAMSGEVGTEAAALRIFPTPAMVLIDVDGSLPPAQLGPKGAKLAAQAIRRMGLAGSIGIDLPTMNNKDERAIAAAQIDKVLPQPFERTAVNGFGFVQIIRRRERASLMELLRADPVEAATLALLRRAERHGDGGPATINAAPPVIARLQRTPDWIERLARRRGGAVTLQADPAVAISAGHVA
ncbi:ribonuclease [Sphingobium ummariense]|uniref:Ribonuclease n=1 Tax=Sphingobium ummariense RL-3 TaxID=1346791 RepID=T0KBP1_9SPHN|nr:ribonuclease [Sphingobium ummariense]EQB30923.1 ribonuclease [Sphingobium ummariense RL-3]